MCGEGGRSERFFKKCKKIKFFSTSNQCTGLSMCYKNTLHGLKDASVDTHLTDPPPFRPFSKKNKEGGQLTPSHFHYRKKGLLQKNSEIFAEDKGGSVRWVSTDNTSKVLFAAQNYRDDFH